MQFINIKQIVRLVVLFGVVGLMLVFNSLALAGEGYRSPDLPPSCGSLQVPVRIKKTSHSYAVGVQIYRWNGTSWDFVAPLANLYANENFNGKIGFHYAGPTWESNSGSKVVAARVAGCTPDASAIPWLLLQAVSNDGPGIFKKVDYIHRVNTAGGLAPTVAGSVIGEEKRVPYTAEYYFYRVDD